MKQYVINLDAFHIEEKVKNKAYSDNNFTISIYGNRGGGARYVINITFSKWFARYFVKLLLKYFQRQIQITTNDLNNFKESMNE